MIWVEVFCTTFRLTLAELLSVHREASVIGSTLYLIGFEKFCGTLISREVSFEKEYQILNAFWKDDILTVVQIR